MQTTFMPIIHNGNKFLVGFDKDMYYAELKDKFNSVVSSGTFATCDEMLNYIEAYND